MSKGKRRIPPDEPIRDWSCVHCGRTFTGRITTCFRQSCFDLNRAEPYVFARTKVIEMPACNTFSGLSAYLEDVQAMIPAILGSAAPLKSATSADGLVSIIIHEPIDVVRMAWRFPGVAKDPQRTSCITCMPGIPCTKHEPPRIELPCVNCGERMKPAGSVHCQECGW